MKKTFLYLIAGLLLSSGFVASAYQIEGYYLQLTTGGLHGRVGSTADFTQPNKPLDLYQDYSSASTSFFFSIGGGYSYNTSNSISWQPGLEYYQTNSWQAFGVNYDDDGALLNYDWKARSSGYWLTNRFLFDVFTGSFTPIQPYVTFRLGLARNNSYDFNSDPQTPVAQPITFASQTDLQFAYGIDLGLSYQLTQQQVFSIGFNDWQLGKVELGEKSYPSNDRIPANHLSLLGGSISYLFQF